MSESPALASIAAQLDEVDAAIHESLAPLGIEAPVTAVEELVGAGGKRLRPALVILSAAGGDADGAAVRDVAAGIELIHTASLIHDDIVDGAALRRGRPAVHHRLGIETAVLMGDYCFARGAALLATAGDPRVDSAVSNAVAQMCSGQIAERAESGDFHITERVYVDRIAAKTAALFAAATECGARLAHRSSAAVAAFSRFGTHLGIAFQIVDDLLDYVVTDDRLGKSAGADIREGTVTLPLLLALEERGLGPRLRALLEAGPLDDGRCRRIVDAVRSSAAVERTRQAAQNHLERARGALRDVADTAVLRPLVELSDLVLPSGASPATGAV